MVNELTIIESYLRELAVVGYVFMLFSSLIIGGLITVFIAQIIADKLLQVEKKTHAYLRIRELESENIRLSNELNEALASDAKGHDDNA